MAEFLEGISLFPVLLTMATYQLGLWCSKKEHIAVYTAHVPHILTFEIRGIAPTYDLNTDIVLALAKVICNIKFGIIVAALCIAYIVAVHPYERSTIDTVKVQEHTLVAPSGRHLEIPAV